MWLTGRLLDSYRAESEDRAEIIPLSPESKLFLLADGVGGRANGATAASRAIDLARTAVGESSEGERDDPRYYADLLRRIDADLDATPDCGETTLIVLYLSASRIVGASVGDSEAWWVSDAERWQILTREQHHKPYLGIGMSRPVSFSYRTPRTGTLLVGSDGLFKYASSERIVAAVALEEEPDDMAIALNEVARGTSGKLYDDFAVLLARAENG